jgi:hypothetical protein
MPTVIVERSLPAPVTPDDLSAMEEAVQWCLELHKVKFLYSWLSKDRTRMLCLYEAPDAEAVRKTQDTGKLPYDCVYTVEKYPFEQ